MCWHLSFVNAMWHQRNVVFFFHVLDELHRRNAKRLYQLLTAIWGTDNDDSSWTCASCSVHIQNISVSWLTLQPQPTVVDLSTLQLWVFGSQSCLGWQKAFKHLRFLATRLFLLVPNDSSLGGGHPWKGKWEGCKLQEQYSGRQYTKHESREAWGRFCFCCQFVVITLWCSKCKSTFVCKCTHMYMCVQCKWTVGPGKGKMHNLKWVLDLDSHTIVVETAANWISRWFFRSDSFWALDVYTEELKWDGLIE